MEITKPQIKREVAIRTVHRESNLIIFYATKDAVTEFENYGDILEGDHKGEYWLKVDPRFDFQDVFNYIENYGK